MKNFILCAVLCLAGKSMKKNCNDPEEFRPQFFDMKYWF